MSQKLLITGITGFVGSRVLLEALQVGYHVRGIVLDEAEKEAVQSLRILEKFQRQLEITIVPDIRPEGVYDSLTDGVGFVIHIASPIPQPVRASRLLCRYSPLEAELWIRLTSK
jgi:uncharacterized protein YbjT (DUF2867 family)